MAITIATNYREFIEALVKNPHARCEAAQNEGGGAVIRVISSGNKAGALGTFFEHPVKALFKRGELHDEQAHAVAEILAQWGRFKNIPFSGFGKDHITAANHEDSALAIYIKDIATDARADVQEALAKARKWELRAWAVNNGLDATATIADAIAVNETRGSVTTLNLSPEDLEANPQLRDIANKRIFRNFNDADYTTLKEFQDDPRPVARDYVEDGYIAIEVPGKPKRAVPSTEVGIDRAITANPFDDVVPEPIDKPSARTLALRKQAAAQQPKNPFDESTELPVAVLVTPVPPVPVHVQVEAVTTAPSAFIPEPQKPVVDHAKIIAKQIGVFYKSAPIAENAYANFETQFAQEAEWGNSMYLRLNEGAKGVVEGLLKSAKTAEAESSVLYNQTLENAAAGHIVMDSVQLAGLYTDMQAFAKRARDLQEVLDGYGFEGKRWHGSALTLEVAAAKAAKEVHVVNEIGEGYVRNFQKHMKSLMLTNAAEIDPITNPALHTDKLKAKVKHNAIVGLYAQILKDGTPLVVQSEYNYHQRFISSSTTREWLRAIVQSTGKTLSDLNHSIQSQISQINANYETYQAVNSSADDREKNALLEAKHLRPVNGAVHELAADLVAKAQYAGLSEGASALINAIERGGDALTRLIHAEAQVTLNQPGVR